MPTFPTIFCRNGAAFVPAYKITTPESPATVVFRQSLVGRRHFDALVESQTVVAQSFNAQPEAPAERADAGASGWALNAIPFNNALLPGILVSF